MNRNDWLALCIVIFCIVFVVPQVSCGDSKLAVQAQATFPPFPTDEPCATALVKCEAGRATDWAVYQRCEEYAPATIAALQTDVARAEHRAEVAETGWRECLDWCASTATAEARVWQIALPLAVSSW